ncbi:MAG: hypothetical protein AB7G39_11490 [Alphaproteobacteria bacterium]
MIRSLLLAIALLAAAAPASQAEIATAGAEPPMQCASESLTAPTAAGAPLRVARAKSCEAGTACREGCRTRYSVCTGSGGHSADSCRQVRDACIQSCNAANCN